MFIIVFFFLILKVLYTLEFGCAKNLLEKLKCYLSTIINIIASYKIYVKKTIIFFFTIWSFDDHFVYQII